MYSQTEIECTPKPCPRLEVLGPNALTTKQVGKTFLKFSPGEKTFPRVPVRRVRITVLKNSQIPDFS